MSHYRLPQTALRWSKRLRSTAFYPQRRSICACPLSPALYTRGIENKTLFVGPDKMKGTPWE